MKVLYRGRHVKTIPQRYQPIGQKVLGEMFKDCTKKRLNEQERLQLEVELLKSGMRKCDLELLEGREFTGVARVLVKFGTPYYVAMFGSLQVRCKEGLYDLCPNKKTITKYHN